MANDIKNKDNKTPMLSENKKVSIVHTTLPSNCTVYYVYETMGAEKLHEADEIAFIMSQALNKYLNSKR